MERVSENPGFSLVDALGAAEGASSECLTLYIPSKDSAGNDFEQRPWVEEALDLLSGIGGGATVLPPAARAWLNPETGALIREDVVLAYTYVDPDKFEASLGMLREFTHRLGRETRQGEVAVEFAGRLYKIRQYDRG
jgi:hypothetical protein